MLRGFGAVTALAARSAAAEAIAFPPALRPCVAAARSLQERWFSGSSAGSSAAADASTAPFDATAAPSTRRPGVLAVKAGMTQEWDEWGVRVPLTVLWIDECQVVQVKTSEREGYDAVQVGAGAKRAKSLPPTLLGHYAAAGVGIKRSAAEFRATRDVLDSLRPGQEIRADYFVAGQHVDVSGQTQGKGFQGAMKRHGFGGGNASHGSSLFHRGLGSTGANQDPGKVWKGKKMAGRMGGVRRTVQSALVYKVDPTRNLIYVVGQVPGNRGGIVRVGDAIKKTFQDEPPRPLLPPAAGEPAPVSIAPKGEKDPYAIAEA